MFLRLFILFTLVPLIEIYLFIRIGAMIGAGPTVAVILITGALGAWLARQQGFTVVKRIQAEMTQGIPPAAQIFDGALILAGGILLITPGFLTDAFGFILLIPPTRAVVRSYLARWAKRRVEIQQGVIDI